MKDVLESALHLAFMAGKAHEGSEDDRLDPGSRDECRTRAERLMIEAWERLADLPGDVGDAARAELKRMKWLQVNRID
jgi:hypothetical protein